MKLDRVLVPIDFSDQSRNALHNADELVHDRGGQLTLLHVHSIVGVAVLDFTYVERPQDMARITEAAEAHLKQWAAELKTPRARVQIEVATGEPVSEIVRHTEGCDLAVLGTHGRNGLTRFLMGSVAERVVRGAHCSVLIVRGAVTTPA